MPDAMTVPARIRRYRERAGLSVAAAAALAPPGITEQVWADIEAEARPLTIGQLGGISGALSVPIVVLEGKLTPVDVAPDNPLAEVLEHMSFLMMLDVHLREIRVGVHARLPEGQLALDQPLVVSVSAETGL